MGIDVGAHTFIANTSAALTLTTPSITTSAAGSTFVIAESKVGAPAPLTPVDSKSNTYTIIQSSIAAAGGYSASWYYCQNGVGGATHNATVKTEDGVTSRQMAGYLIEITGGLTSGIKDQDVAGFADAASPFTTNTTSTTTQADELALAFYSTDTTSGTTEVITWGNGFSQVDADGDTSTTTGGFGKKVLTSTGTVQCSITSSGGGTTDTLGFVATFKAAAASAAAPRLFEHLARSFGGGLMMTPRPFLIRLQPGTPQSGNVYDVDAADSAAATDDATGVAAFPASAADSAAASDSATQLAVLPAAAADSVAATDSATQLAVLPAAAADSVAATDAATQLAVLPAAAADSAAATDSATAVAAFPAAGADSAAATDSATQLAVLPASASDSAAATDSATQLAVLPAAAADSVAATDAATQLAVLPASAADSAAATDSATAAAVFAAVAADSAAATDAADAATAFNLDAADSVSATDAATQIAVLVAAAADAAVAGDEASQLAVLAIQAADSVAATDTATSVLVGSGLSDQHHAWLEILARVHGLVAPLAISPTARSDGTLVQTVADGGTSVTVTTTAAPSGTPGTSGLTAQEALWLEQLIRIYGALAPSVVTATGRSDGTLSQTFTVVGTTTTVSTP